MIPLLIASAVTLPTPTPNTTSNAKPAEILSQAPSNSAAAPKPSASESLPTSYPYASIQAGVGFPNNLRGNFDFLGLATLQNTLNLNTGFNGEAALGYKFPDFRTDLSIGYSNFGSKTQTITVPNFGSASVSGTGSVSLFTVMANAYYDFKIKKDDGTLSRWSPYVGAGIGWGNLSTPTCAITNCTLFSGGSASTFAYQGKVGVSYKATDSGFLYLEGGYLGTTSAQVNTVSYDAFGTWRLNLGWRQKL